MAEAGENEWELSKENVQPLRSGRKLANLSAALQPHTPDQLARLREERKTFENDIRMYSGDDALDPWYRYIKWIEQNFPKGGKEINLTQLLESCVEKFGNEKKYQNDPRFLDVWIKFANLCNVPLEIYNYIFSQGIGSDLAAFYEAWAWEYERIGNTKRANVIFTQGIDKGAQPLDMLKNKHSEFQARVARMTMTGQLATPPPAPELGRSTLGELKGRGRDKKAPVNRISAQTPALGPQRNNTRTPDQQGIGFSIHCDGGGASGSSLPPQTGEYASRPGGKETVKENMQDPSQWNKVKVKQRNLPSVSMAEVGAMTNPTFAIHEDLDDPDNQPMITPRKVPSTSQVLSTKKGSKKGDDLFAHFQELLKNNPNEKPMYDKQMIYGGTEEYSFEEIRAIKFIEKRRKMKEELLQNKPNERPMYDKVRIYGGNEELSFEEIRAKIFKEKRNQRKLKEEQAKILAEKQRIDVEKTQLAKERALQEQDLHSQKDQLQAEKAQLAKEREDIRKLQEQLLGLQTQASQYTQHQLEHQPQIQAAMKQKQAQLSQTLLQLQNQQDKGDASGSTLFPNQNHSSQSFSICTDSIPAAHSPMQTEKPPAPFPIFMDDAPQQHKQKTTSFQIFEDNSNDKKDQTAAPSFQIFDDSSSQMPASFNDSKSTKCKNMQAKPVINNAGIQESAHVNRCLAFNQSTAGLDQTKTPSTEEIVGFSLNSTSSSGMSKFKNCTPDISGLSLNNTSSNAKSKLMDPSSDSLKLSIGKNMSAYGGITAPSPTVNTKQALKVVFGMFNHTINPESEFGWQDKPQDDFEAEFASEPADPMQFSADSPVLPPSASAAPFAIYDDSAPAAAAPAAAAPSSAAASAIQIYADPDKENSMPAMSAKKSTKGLGLHKETIAEPKEMIYEVVMADPNDTEEVISQQREEEAMEGLDCGDMTFAPYVASTRNFTEAARLASTPFNSALPESLPQPPVSNIKAPLCSASEASSMNDACSVAGSSLSMTGQNVTPADDTSSNNSTARRKSLFNNQEPNDLSPIMELSDEVNKSHSTTHCTTQGPNTTHTTMSQKAASPVVSLAAIAETYVPPLSPESPAAKTPNADITIHEIDLTNYHPAEDEKTANSNDMSIMIDPHDPFDDERVAAFLAKLDKPLSSYPNYHSLDESLPQFVKNQLTALGERLYKVDCLLGKGAYAMVYKASHRDPNDMDFDDDLDLDAEEVVFKVQKPACPWEFYITSELHRRLQELSPQNTVCSSFMTVEQGYFFTDGSCLVNELFRKGTLLDFVNLHKKASLGIQPLFLLYLSIELLKVAEQLQACDIIHGDIKPDNFLFKGKPTFSSYSVNDVLSSSPPTCLRLIDFGRSIDMRMYPAGTTFTAKVCTSGFQCIEMQTNRPWTWQTDLFGIVGTIYVLLFGQYMKVYCSGGVWKTTMSVKRYITGSEIYEELFATVLNIPSCDQLPNLATFRERFQEKLREKFSGDKLSEYLTKMTIMYHDLW